MSEPNKVERFLIIYPDLLPVIYIVIGWFAIALSLIYGISKNHIPIINELKQPCTTESVK